MSDLTTDTQSQPQPDADAMAAMMAKIARIQKILGLFSWLQCIVGVLFLVSPLWAAAFALELSIPAFMLLAPFLFGLSYAAHFAKKDLSFARVVFRNSAISYLLLLLVSVFALVSGWSAIMFGILLVLSVIIGGLASLVIYQASKQ